MEKNSRVESLRDVGAGRVVTVSVPVRLTYDLDKLSVITRNVLERLGCDRCHSGFDIRFRSILDFAVNPATGAVQEQVALPARG